MNKPLIEVILSYFKYKQRLNIIKYSKKVQEYFNVGLRDYIGLNAISCFYKKYGMSLQTIDDDNELLYHTVTSFPQFKEESNEIKVRNMLYHQQLVYCDVDYSIVNQCILFNNNKYSFSCVFYDDSCKVLLAGTDKGELFTFQVGVDKSKWNIISKFHEGKISKIIQLKKSDIIFNNSNTKYYVSCSVRKGEISIWTINNISNDITQLIKVNDFGPAVFTVIEYKPNLLALGTTHGVLFYNIKTQQNSFIDHYTSSTYSLLEMNEHKHQLIIGSNKCAIVNTKFNHYNDPETLISVTPGALAVRSIIKVNEMIIIAEDDHLKFCEFTLNYDNPNVDRDVHGLGAECKSRIIKLDKKKEEFNSSSGSDKGKTDSYVEAQVLQRKHIIPILKVEALVDKGFIVSCAEDNNIMFWDLNKKEIDFIIASGHVKNISDFCMITNNEGFITVGKDGKIILINNYMECYYDEYFNRYSENNNNNTYYNCVKLQNISEYTHSY